MRIERLKMPCAAVVAASGLMCALACAADELEYDPWWHIPLHIALTPGVERTLIFPEPLSRVRVPDALTGKLRAQVAGNSVHLRAAEPFEKRRLIVDAARGDDIYLLDVGADADAALGDAVVRVRRRARDAERRVHAEPAPIRLTRFAARQLYAPARLRSRDAGIRRYPISGEAIDPPLIQGAALEYRLLGAWRGHGRHLTAVHVRNRSQLRLPLDPRLMRHDRIRGAWLASTFQHRWLEPAGSSGDADSTVLYLVSERPFRQSFDSGARR